MKRWPQLVRDIVSVLRGNYYFLPMQHGTQTIVDGGLTCWVTMKRLECCLVIDRQQDEILASCPGTMGCPWVLALARLGLTGATW